MQEVARGYYVGERALFGAKDMKISEAVFAEGESPLKESSDIELYRCLFKWKYPLWYSKNILVKDSTLFDMARAGIWYTDNIRMENTIVEAPKNFSRCNGVELKKVSFPYASETLWNCENVTMEQVIARGDYFAMNCSNMTIRDFELDGNYSFDGVKNVEVHNARMLSKDAFWNSDHVTVYDSFISGEYLGWNAKNLTLINCTIESLQGMCYINNLTMKNCRLINTTLAFEYSSVDAQIDGAIDSVFNPGSGTIQADYIEELIMEKDKVDPGRTTIKCTNGIGKETQKFVTGGNVHEV